MTNNINSGMMQTLHRFQANQARLSQSLTRLSTGQAINRGVDDPAGLIISTQLDAALAALDAESRAYQRNHYIAATAEASLDEVSTLLRDNQGLETQLANTGAISSDERAAIQQQIDANIQSIDRITANARFNGQALFDGSITLSAGGETLDLPDLSSSSLGATDIDGTTYYLDDTASKGAAADIPLSSTQILDKAINDISTLRGKIGAFESNSIDSLKNAGSIAIENLAAARSEIADTDFASELTKLNRETILQKTMIKSLGILAHSQDKLMELLS